MDQQQPAPDSYPKQLLKWALVFFAMLAFVALVKGVARLGDYVRELDKKQRARE